jgi:hypothetical protein
VSLTDCGLAASDRAISDVVGYVLIFSLIVATVGVVTTAGFGALDDRQAAERINNVERAFDVYASNIEDVYRDGAPSRATEMRLAGGTIRHGDPVTITIADATDESQNVTTVLRPTIYVDGDTEIVYVAGAVLRSSGDSSIVLRDPPFRPDSSTASFPLVQTYRISGPVSLASDGTVRVTSTARGVNTTLPASFDGASGYNVTVESPRDDAWAQYFESDSGFNDVTRDESAGTVTATVDADTLVAPRFLIQIRFST